MMFTNRLHNRPVVISYHSVSPYANNKLGPWVELDQFRAQLIEIHRYFDVINPAFFSNHDLLNSDKKQVLLTFDDCQVQSVNLILQELDKLGIKGLFFALPDWDQEEDLCHPLFLIQNLVPLVGWRRFLECLPFTVSLKVSAALIYSRKYAYNLISYYIRNLPRVKLLSLARTFRERGLFPTQRLFLSKLEMKDLLEQGHLVGSHSINHLAMTSLSSAELEQEAFESYNNLKSILPGSSSKLFFSFPFSAYNQPVVDAVRRVGFELLCANIPQANLSQKIREDIIYRTCCDKYGPLEIVTLAEKG